MNKINVLCLVGGISRKSLNKKLYRAVKEHALDNINLRTFDISKIPFFSQDLENDPPDIVTEWKDLIRESDAVIFITPEYNRSFPGVLKNAIDWGSRPYGQNLWDKKPAGLMGASISNTGTYGAQHHLRDVLSYLNMSVMGQPEFYFNGANSFNAEGKLIDDKTKSYIENYWDAFGLWIERVSDRRDFPKEQKFLSKGIEDSPFPH